jgi:mannan endo-1,4-beta-mannosidase
VAEHRRRAEGTGRGFAPRYRAGLRNAQRGKEPRSIERSRREPERPGWETRRLPLTPSAPRGRKALPRLRILFRQRRKVPRAVTIGAAIIVAAAMSLAAALDGKSAGHKSASKGAPLPVTVPRKHGIYLGVYAPGAPQSYAGVTAFTATTGVRPGLVVYYSGWKEPFQGRFAANAARHHAVPLVQIDPTGISLSAIASGRFDAYLRSYASAVKAFGGQTILSFGHEMNGHWYSWGYRHTSPAVFVAAWRHIVQVFRAMSADNVTWLWTVNIIGRNGGIPSPAAWWPGDSYVTWVGIDGYYYKRSWTFASLFGPTIKAVRALTLDPILISETGAAPTAGKPAKVADLFAGIRAYGLLGFVWFDAGRKRDWRLDSPAAIAAFRRGAMTLKRPGL